MVNGIITEVCDCMRLFGTAVFFIFHGVAGGTVCRGYYQVNVVTEMLKCVLMFRGA